MLCRVVPEPSRHRIVLIVVRCGSSIEFAATADGFVGRLLLKVTRQIASKRQRASAIVPVQRPSPPLRQTFSDGISPEVVGALNSGFDGVVAKHDDPSPISEHGIIFRH